MSQTASYVANADITSPSVFVKLLAGSDHRIVICGADDIAEGVLHESTTEAAIPGITTKAAEAGKSTRVYGIGENCEVLAGAACAAGDFLKPDAAGKAIPATTGENYSAKCRGGAAAANERVQCTVEHGQMP